jgi:hypothetical protein
MSRREFIEVMAVAFLLAFALTFMFIFNQAVFGGGSTTVYIDKLNEQFIEQVVFTLICWPVISVGIYYWTLGGDD